MSKEVVVTVNGEEVQPGKKVKLYKIKSVKEINDLLKKKRQELIEETSSE